MCATLIDYMCFLYEIINFSITMLHIMLLHNVTCYTNYLLSCAHVNTTKLRIITCTLVATCMILRSLGCTRLGLQPQLGGFGHNRVLGVLIT